MKEPTRYIHIGYPKCASTALQTHFFSRHTDLHHLGAGSGGSIASYVNSEILTEIEVSLRIEKDSVFNQDNSRRIFNKEFSTAYELNKLAVGISSESLSFTMHHDIDPSQKATRLHSIFGQNTRIIIVIREQWALLKSLYREYVLGGLHLTFDEFTKSIYYNQARSCLFDLNFANTQSLYADLFGKENVLIIAFENLRDYAAENLAVIQNHIGIQVKIDSLPKENTKEDAYLLESARRLNCAVRLNHARSVIEPIGAFRYPEYFEKKLGVPIAPSIVDDQNYIDRIRDLANPKKIPYKTQPISYDIDPLIKERIDSLFKEWNSRLANPDNLTLDRLGYIM